MGKSQPQRRQAAPAPAAHGGVPCEGWFKSFSAKDGYSFLQCPDLQGDIFVSFKIAPELRTLLEQVGDLKAQAATFVAHDSLTNPGQYEGRDVALLGYAVDLSSVAGNAKGKGGAGASASSGYGKTRPTSSVVASPCGKGGKKAKAKR